MMNHNPVFRVPSPTIDLINGSIVFTRMDEQIRKRPGWVNLYEEKKTPTPYVGGAASRDLPFESLEAL